MNTPLLGVSAKLNRAQQHIDDLTAAIEKWHADEKQVNSGQFNFVFKPDRRALEIAHGEVRPNDMQWTLIIGDFIHNLRCALDHVVCQLAIRNGNDFSCCEKTFFPIALDDAPDKNWRTEKWVRPLLRPEHFAFIEELQPYNTAKRFGHPPANSLLWIIERLDIIDKHRMALVSVKHFRPTSIEVAIVGGEKILHTPPDPSSWHPLVDGAHIASVDFSNVTLPREGEMKVNANTEQAICFHGTNLVIDRKPVLAVLPQCLALVSGIINDIEARFFSN